MARILITSGPTRQYLDPVRYLTNGSSGRMGQALAQAVAGRRPPGRGGEWAGGDRLSRRRRSDLGRFHGGDARGLPGGLSAV